MRSQIMASKPHKEWHSWFAFIPHKVWLDEYNGDTRYQWVWWEWVEYHTGYLIDFSYTIYRFPERGP